MRRAGRNLFRLRLKLSSAELIVLSNESSYLNSKNLAHDFRRHQSEEKINYKFYFHIFIEHSSSESQMISILKSKKYVNR